MTLEPAQADRDLDRKHPEPAREAPALDPAVHPLGNVLGAFGSDRSDTANARLISCSVVQRRANSQVRALVMRSVQQGAGNHRAQQLFAQLRHSSFVQRSCSCGTCAACQEKAGDEEEESKVVQRQAATNAPGGGMAGANVIPPGEGEPLDRQTRNLMEPRFGGDLSGVRVHTDTPAAESADALGADAYTTGRNIYFASGKYAPASQEGQRLIAHELTHTVQQAKGAAPTRAQRAGNVTIGDENDPLEIEAQRVADGAQFLAPDPPRLGPSLGTQPLVQRQAASPDVDAMRQDFTDSVGRGDFEHAAEVLNAFNLADIQSLLAGRSLAQIASIHVGAISNPKVGPDSNAANVTRPAFLDANYMENLRAGAWQDAAKYLNGFNSDDIVRRLSRLSLTQIQALHDGAVANPVVGDQSQVATLTAQMISDLTAKAAAAQGPSQGTTAPAGDGGAPAPSSDSGVPPPADEAVKTRQLLCVIRLGACPNDPDVSGVPEQATLDKYNEECKKETGYARQNVYPSQEECAHPPAAPAEAVGDTCPQTVEPEIANLSASDKLGSAWEAADIAGEARTQLAQFFSPENIGMMIGFGILFIAIQGTPVGWIGDAITVIFLGKILFDVIGDLLEFFSAINATNKCQIHRAGHGLASAIVEGSIALVLELLTHEAPGKGRGPEGPPPEGMVDALTNNGQGVRMPKDTAEGIVAKRSAEGRPVEVKGGELGPEATPIEKQGSGAGKGEGEGGGTRGTDIDDVAESEADKAAEKEKPLEADPEIDPAVCFPAGTLVSTVRGMRPIETLRSGESVYGYDFETNAVVRRAILGATRGSTSVWVEIGLGSQFLTATRNHPVWVETQQNWVSAEQVVPGMTLRRLDGSLVEVTEVRIAPQLESQETYNLTIDRSENFFAGELQLLVHNIAPSDIKLKLSRIKYFNRPRYSNYVLREGGPTGRIYYSGMFGENSTAADVQYRHAKTGQGAGRRFDPSKGDYFELVPGTRTYGEARLLEHRNAVQNKTIIGRAGDNYRGNRQDPVAADKLPEYEAYEKYRQGCG